MGKYIMFSNSSSIYCKTSRSKPHIIIRSIAKMVVAKVCINITTRVYSRTKKPHKTEKKKRKEKK